MFSTLEVDGSDPLRVLSYEGVEQISALWHFEVFITSDDTALPFADFVGKKAKLTIGDVKGAHRRVHGLVRRFELSHQSGNQRARYRFELVPLAHRLTLKTDCRIFQQKSVKDIVEEVLGAWSIEAHDLALTGSYATREYCVQYRESDWAFINRLMEEEGIFYYFEHGDDEAKLVIGDSPSAHNPIPGNALVTFRPETGALGDAHEHVTRLAFGEEVLSGKVTLRDYNFKTPSLDLEASKAADLEQECEVYDFPGRYPDTGVGGGLAERLLEARQVYRKSGHGAGTALRFMAGQKFELGDNADDDIRDDLNIEYLITRVQHRGMEPAIAAESKVEAYTNTFSVIPADVPFRPQHRIPKPRIHGAQTAVVTGPGGEEIHTDEHGRIKVQFHWDRLGNNDENSSCWVRVAQPWAGAGWGSVFIPRIGMEVVIDFLEGDPDRPLCTGSVYHASNVPPYGLPGEKTKSTLKSNTTVGGGGFNEIRFEDAAGNEEIFIHGQKDWIIVIENDRGMLIKRHETLQVGGDRSRSVAGTETVSVDGDRTKTVGSNENYMITADRGVSVGGNNGCTVGGDDSKNVGGSQTLSVTANRTSGVGGNQTEAVGLNASLTVGGALAQTVGMGITQTVGANASLNVGKNQTVQVNKDRTTQVMGKQDTNVGKKWTIVVGDEIEITCDKAKLVMKKDGTIQAEGKDINVKASGKVTVDAKKDVTVKAKKANIKASGQIKAKGSKIALN